MRCAVRCCVWLTTHHTLFHTPCFYYGVRPAGVESSHSHFAGDLNYARGYEWRLMVEARKRNPAILLGALAWAWPGYIGAGTSSPWTNNTLSVGYILDWMKGARDVYNVTVDFIDADWNERASEISASLSLVLAFASLVFRPAWGIPIVNAAGVVRIPSHTPHMQGYSTDFVKELRTALNGAGFASTFLVCGDDIRIFHCAADAAKDPVLAAAVYAYGAHNPQPDPVSAAQGVPLWGSELEGADPGGTDTATQYHTLYNNQNVTG